MDLAQSNCFLSLFASLPCKFCSQQRFFWSHLDAILNLFAVQPFWRFVWAILSFSQANLNLLGAISDILLKTNDLSKPHFGGRCWLLEAVCFRLLKAKIYSKRHKMLHGLQEAEICSKKLKMSFPHCMFIAEKSLKWAGGQEYNFSGTRERGGHFGTPTEALF